MITSYSLVTEFCNFSNKIVAFYFTLNFTQDICLDIHCIISHARNNFKYYATSSRITYYVTL